MNIRDNTSLLAAAIGIMFMAAADRTCAQSAGQASSLEQAKASLTQAQSRYAEARTRRDDINRQLQNAQQRANAIASRGANVGELDRSIFRIDQQILALSAQARSAIDEMRAGMFCSGCNRTRSDILASGDTFPHPGQTIIAATAEQIQAVASKYSAAIEQLQSQKQALTAERTQKLKEYEAQLATARAPVSQLQSAYSAANSAINQAGSDVARARSAVNLQEQREQMLAAEKRRVEAEKYRQELEKIRREREEAESEASLASLQLQLFRQQVANMPSQQAATAAERTLQETQVNEAATRTRDKVQQIESKEAEIAKAISRPVTTSGPDSAIAESYKKLERIETNERTQVAERTDSGSRLLDSAGEVPTRDVAATSNWMPDRVNRLVSAVDEAGKSAIPQVRAEIKSFIEAQLQEVQDQLRPDLIGLGSLEGSDAVDPATPLKIVRAQTSDALKDASTTILGDLPERSQFVQRVTEWKIAAAADWFAQEVTNRIASVYNDNVLGLEDKSHSADSLERSEDAFYKAVSPATLVLKTGGKSIIGLRDYLHDTQAKFFEYLDLAFDRQIAEINAP